jgi:type IX secretion system PorP/SprF family membrane protein
MRNLYFTSVLFVLFSLFFIEKSNAQQDEQLSLYNYNPLYYNPAYAGSRDALSVVSMARFQWINFDGAPNTQFFTVHAPILGQSLGMGLNLVNDRIGSRQRTAAFYNASSGIRLNENNHRLAFGMSFGMDVMSYDFSDLSVHDVSDPFYGQQIATTKGNIGAGLYYYSDHHYVGISSPRILESKALDNDNIMTALNQRHFFITAGKLFDINSVIKFKPTTLIKMTPDAPLTFDVNANFMMYERFWLGSFYRFHEAVGLNFVYNYKNWIHIGYGYEFPINRLVNYQSGSHEIVLQLDIRPKTNLFTSPRYF